MTREEAKTRLQILLTNRCSTCRCCDKKCTQVCKFGQAVNMAIEALSAEQKEEDLAKDIARRMATIIENEQDMRVILKSTEPTDLISRADAIKAVANAIWHYPNECYRNLNVFDMAEALAKDAIKSLPSADRPSGEWIPFDNHYKCDQCGFEPVYEKTIKSIHFCPNCGAKMGSDTR